MNEGIDAYWSSDPAPETTMNHHETTRKQRINRVDNKIGPEREELIFEKGLHEGGEINNMNSERPITPFSWKVPDFSDTILENGLNAARRIVSDDLANIQDQGDFEDAEEPTKFSIFLLHQMHEHVQENLAGAETVAIVEYLGFMDVFGINSAGELVDYADFYGRPMHDYPMFAEVAAPLTKNASEKDDIFIFYKVPDKLREVYKDLELGEDLHVTLAYREGVDSDETSRNSLLKEIASIVRHIPNQDAELGGLAQFDNDANSIVALINLKDGAELYTNITQAISNVHGDWEREFDFTPHCTLQFKPEVELGAIEFKPMEWSNDYVGVKFNDDTVYKVMLDSGEIEKVDGMESIFKEGELSWVTAAPESYTSGSDVDQPVFNQTVDQFHQRTEEGDWEPGVPEVDYHYFNDDVFQELDHQSGDAYKAFANLRFFGSPTTTQFGVEPLTADDILEVHRIEESGEQAHPEDVLEYIYEAVDWTKSVKLVDSETGNLAGFYLLAESLISKVDPDIQQFQMEDRESFEGKSGVEGVSLYVAPEYRNQGAATVLKDYAEGLGYDYVWGYQSTFLNNMEQWLKRREYYGNTTDSHVTVKRLWDTNKAASMDPTMDYDPTRGDKFHWESPDGAGETSMDMQQSWNQHDNLPDLQKEEKEISTSTFEGRENLALGM